MSCLICGCKLECVNATHLKKHGISTAQYREKYPSAEFMSNSLRKRINISHIGKKHSLVWRQNISKGKLGKTFTAEHRNNLSISHKGKKHTEEYKLHMSNINRIRYKDPKERKKTSDAGKKYYREHPETCKVLSDMGIKRYKDPRERKKSSEAQLERYRKETPEEYKRRCESARKATKKTYDNGRVISLGSNESIEHLNTKNFIVDLLRSQDATVITEKFVTINGCCYAVDVYAKKKNGEVMIFEVGDCDPKKLFNLRTYYTRVFQVPKMTNGRGR